MSGDTPDGEAIVASLEESRTTGASRDALLREAVRLVAGASSRFDWVGVYLLEGDVLVLHNHVGKPTEHSRIPVGVGVCGTAVAEDKNIIVTDVRATDNYLACSAETRAEMVVLLRRRSTGTAVGQLDLDSDRVGAFTENDRAELELVAAWLGGLFG
jgi:GAF domain-containing protein